MSTKFMRNLRGVPAWLPRLALAILFFLLSRCLEIFGGQQFGALYRVVPIDVEGALIDLTLFLSVVTLAWWFAQWIFPGSVRSSRRAMMTFLFIYILFSFGLSNVYFWVTLQSWFINDVPTNIDNTISSFLSVLQNTSFLFLALAILLKWGRGVTIVMVNWVILVAWYNFGEYFADSFTYVLFHANPSVTMDAPRFCCSQFNTFNDPNSFLHWSMMLVGVAMFVVVAWRLSGQQSGLKTAIDHRSGDVHVTT